MRAKAASMAAMVGASAMTHALWRTPSRAVKSMSGVAVALLAAIVIAVGAFAPTLASQLLGTPAVLGGMLLLVLWGAREIVHNLNSRTIKKAADTPPVVEPDPIVEPIAVTEAATEPSQGGNENA